MRFLKLIVADRVSNLFKKLEVWRDFWQLASSEMSTFSPKTCIKSVKNCLTNLTPLVSLIQTTKNSIKYGIFWLWFNLCGRRKLLRYRNDNKDWERFSNFGIDVAQLDTGTHFPLRPQSSWLGIMFQWWFGDICYVK